MKYDVAVKDSRNSSISRVIISGIGLATTEPMTQNKASNKFSRDHALKRKSVEKRVKDNE